MEWKIAIIIVILKIIILIFSSFLINCKFMSLHYIIRKIIVSSF
nr:MAG TPA: hypothetical protein [Bacteriophage sp.]